MIYFYPRSPCGERLSAARCTRPLLTFLSTLSLRRATRHPERRTAGNRYFYPRSPCGERRILCRYDGIDRNFYPRSPCGERPVRDYTSPLTSLISIHALLAESDYALLLATTHVFHFYPRSPCGERRMQVCFFNAHCSISIHALLAESDLILHMAHLMELLFLSTLSLRRATYGLILSTIYRILFLSTLSLRRATAKVHKTVGHFCAYETNFMGIASSC